MLLFVPGSNVYGQSPIQVGEEVTFSRESPHPYNGSQEAAVVWRDTIVYVDSACAYIAVHFSSFGLDELDTIVVRNLDNTVSYQYSYEWLSSLDSFWSPPISGNTIILEIHVEDSQGDYGYTIDKLARGFTEIEMAARLGESCPYCCGDDNKLNAICFQSLDPFAYHHSKGSGRVWGNPMEIIGTGFFWGGEGHFMTAMHILNTGMYPASYSSNAKTMMVEIMAESDDCSNNCNYFCAGQFVSLGFTEIAYSLKQDFDFTLLKLNLLTLPPEGEENITYLQVRESGPKLNEPVYIPGHPINRGKVLYYYSDQSADILLTENLHNGLGLLHLQTIDHLFFEKEIPFSPPVGYGMTYYGDSEGNMSGSPVIAYQDNLVVGYHTNGSFTSEGSCPNGGVNIKAALEIIDPSLLPPNAIGVDCYPGWADITISEDELIDDVFLSTGNIYIQNGAQLHVTGTLYMPEGGEIVVERNARLAVYEGGTVTKCPHSRDKWQGIKLRGNSSLAQPDFNINPYFPLLDDPDQAGEVFVNDGYILHAAVAISTRNANNDPDYYGGVIYIEKGWFNYNTLTIELMPYPMQNKSRIKSAVFHNSDVLADNAIWMSGNTGIEVSKSRFVSFNHEAIRAFDSAIRILDENRFQGCEQAISLLATMPNPFAEKSKIGTLDMTPNQFQNNTFHITGWGPPRVDVLMNEFEGGTTGIHIAGSSRYNITGNSFEDMDRGVVLYSTGFNQSAISNLSCNQFAINDYGSIAVGDNQRTRYWGNQFDLTGTASRDLMVSQFSVPGWALYPGQLYQPQGDIQFPTDNCFTEPGQKIDILTNGSTVHFDYFHRPSGTMTCGYEPLNPGNYEPIETSPNLEPHDCYQFVEGTSIPEYHTLTELDSLRQVINELSPHTSSSLDTLVWYNQVWGAKEALLHHLVMAALDTNDMTSAEQIIQGENSVAADWAIYGLRLSRGDISGAASWLAQMSDTSAVEQDFYDIQAIHLAYRHDTTGTFVLDSVQQSYLEDVAYGGSPVRDYARSLLGLLTGHRFYPEIPEEEAELHSADQDSISWRQPDWNIYPVPASNELIIKWKVLDNEDTWQISLNDMLGRLVLTDLIQASTGLHFMDLNGFSEGVFYITIYGQKGEVLHQAPIVIHR